MEIDSDQNLTHNINGYVVKVGTMYASKYSSSAIFGRVTGVSTLTDYLPNINETLTSLKVAQYVAKSVNGKIYKICLEPVEDNEYD